MRLLFKFNINNFCVKQKRFISKSNLHFVEDVEKTIGFERPMKANTIGSVSPYYFHFLVSMRGRSSVDWPTDFDSRFFPYMNQEEVTFFKAWSDAVKSKEALFPNATEEPTPQSILKKSRIIKMTTYEENEDWYPLNDGRDILVYPHNIKLKNVTANDIKSVIAEVTTQTDASKLKLPSTVEVEDISNEKNVLVCIHMTRDLRCGHCGPKLVAELQKELRKSKVSNDNIVVRGVSHIGGHEYAGNVLVYPSANWFGYITPSQVPQLAKYIQDLSLASDPNNIPEELKNHWRGRMALSKEEQIAEYEHVKACGCTNPSTQH